LRHDAFPPEIETPVKAWLRKPHHILIISGNYGCGKTALGAAIVPMIHADKKGRTSRFLKEDQFFSKIKGQFGKDGELDQYVKMLCDDFFFFYDDMGSHAPKAEEEEGNWRRDMIFSMIDFRYSQGSPTVITTNFTREQIKSVYGERILSRLCAKENTWLDLGTGPLQ